MKQLNLTVVPWALAATTLVLLTSCGGGSGDSASPGGLITVADYVIPAGKTQRYSSDAIIVATHSIQIDGTLEGAAGGSLTLISQGALTVNGTIQDSASRAVPIKTRTGAVSPVTTITGQDVTIPGTVRAGAGKPIYIATTDYSGTVSIAGALVTTDAHSNEGPGPVLDGDSGGNVEIGTPAAISAVKAKYAAPADKPGTVRIQGSITAGNGGDGGDDKKGVRTIQTGGRGLVSYKPGRGGNGGSIKITALNFIEIPGSPIINAGDGGRGGHVANNSLVKSGSGVGLPGDDLIAITGAGGDGGSVIYSVTPSKSVGQAGSGGNFGGALGSTTLLSGNGGDGGDGGNVTCMIGLRGQDGTGPTVKHNTYSKRSIFIAIGSGGSSSDASHKGGNGGSCIVTDSAGNAITNLSLSIRGGSGGKGFGGCGTTTTNGTDGGDVGTVQGYAAGVCLVLKGARADADIDASAFTPGDGGDGTPAGRGGKGGVDDAGNVLSSNGKDGALCSNCGSGAPAATYTAVNIGTGAPAAINFAGHVAGYETGSSPTAWFWDGHTKTTIGAGTATAMNDHDVVVGYANDGAFIWDKTGGRRLLSAGTGWTQVQPMGINNSGVIVGYANSPDGIIPVQWTGGVASILPPLGSDTFGKPFPARAFAINDSGTVAGTGVGPSPTNPKFPDGVYAAVRWTGGSAQELTSILTDSRIGSGLAVSPAGDVVGTSRAAFDPGGVFTYAHATIWKAGSTAPTDLEPSDIALEGSARSVNSSLTVVGNQNGEFAVLYIGTAAANLNSRTTISGNPTLSNPSINNCGKIVVFATGSTYLLSPVGRAAMLPASKPAPRNQTTPIRSNGVRPK